MENDLRTGALRGARSYEVDESGETSRINAVGAEARAARTEQHGKSLETFYEDLGISATPEGYKAVSENESAYQKELKAKKGEIATATNSYNSANKTYQEQLAAINKAKSSIPDLNSAVNTSWATYKSSSLVPIRVIGPGDKVEAVYYLPRDTANNLTGKPGIFASWVDGGRNFNVMVKNYRNGELHDALRPAAQNVQSTYMSQAKTKIANEITQANKQITAQAAQLSGVSGQLAEYKGSIDGANNYISAAEKQRADAWKDLRDTYSARTETMKEIFGVA